MLATHCYESVHNTFPIGNDQTFVVLLPYIEQQNLTTYDLYPGDNTTRPDLDAGLKVRIAIFECPANERGPAANMVYQHTESATVTTNTSPYTSYGRVDYAGNAGWIKPLNNVNYTGPFQYSYYSVSLLVSTPPPKQMTVAMISDGLSNTIGFGEIAMNMANTGGPTYMAWSSNPAVMGTSNSPSPITTVNNQGGFSSPHPVCNFAFMDGSVRSLRFFGKYTQTTGLSNADYMAFQMLVGRADGQEVLDTLE